MDGGPRFTLPTRPSRLLRVPSPPVVHDEAPTQIRPYPHSTKRSNAYTQQPQLDGGLENTLKTKDEAALEAAGRRSPQRQAICQIESAGGNKSISEKTKRKVLPHVDSASTLAENQEDVTAIGSKMPILKTAGADVTNAKRGKSVKGIGPLDTRVSSSSTLNDESDLDRPPVTKQFRQFASDIDSEDEKEGGGEDDTDDGAEEDEGLYDDEEEQEISDFDSSGENDDEDSDDHDDAEGTSRGTAYTRTGSFSGGSDNNTFCGPKHLRRGLAAAPNIDSCAEMKSVSAGRKCESAQKYGIAVMIDDEAAIGSDGNDDQHRIKLKPAIVASLFDDGDAVLYFPKEGETVGKIPAELKDAMKWKICKFTPRVIRTCLRRAGFKLVKGGKKWIGYWGKHYPAEKFKTVQPWQKVNHYPMSFEIGRKDKMYLNVCRMRERVKDDCMGLDFLPATYFLPSQRRRLKNAFSSHPSWIIKPPASARGIGIRVVNKWKDVPQRKEFIVSKYIQNPYLIDKKKFDIRLYVVVTSFDPLRVYLFKEGIVRFAGEKYSTSSSKNSIKNRFIHLTNYSVSRKKKSKHPTELPSFPFGDPMFSTSDSKWSLDLLQKYFTRQGINFQKVLENIKHAIVSTVISSHAANSSGTRMYAANVSSCYELFGFDVLLDANLKPWVMEVNISPSLKASCDMDMAVKSRLAVDLFNLVGVRVKDLDASQKKQKKKSYQRPFLTIAERQKMRHFSLNTDFNLLLDLTDHDLRILKESEDENRRRGDFERIFPFVDSSPYFKLFASTPYSDHLLLQWIKIAHVNPIKAYNLLRRSSQFASSAYSSSPHHSSQHLVDSHTGNRSISARLNASGTSTTFKSSTLSVHTVPNFAKDTIVSASRKSSAQVRRNTLLKNDGENIVAMNAAINALESVAIHPQTMEALHVDTTGACLKHELYTPPHHILQEDDPALPLTGMPHLFRGAANPTLYPETSQGHPYATFPERQTMTLNKPSIILSSSNTMLVPGVATTSYVLKPRKISSKPKPEIDHSANQVPPQIMTETAARVISREMQQQQHYHLQHQRFYEQQQLLYLQQHQELQHEYQQQSQPHESFLPRFPSPKDISKEYPSTIAYKAAMAIANVTARFRAIEGTGHGVGGINQKLEVLPEPNYLRREMSQAELMAWAAMTQQQHFRQQEQQQQQQYDMQQHVPHLKPFSNVKIGKEGPFVVETGAASSFIRSRRLMNTPATASRPITGKRI